MLAWGMTTDFFLDQDLGGVPSGYDSQFAMERSTMLLIGKSQFLMGKYPFF